HEEWNVGVVEAPISAFLDPAFSPQVRWMPPPRPGTYRADPFGRVTEFGLQICCEEWDATTGRGQLVALDDAGRSHPMRGFPAGVHHSYPYLLESAGQVYCVPEMCALGEVRLYRAVRWPW